MWQTMFALFGRLSVFVAEVVFERLLEATGVHSVAAQDFLKTKVGVAGSQDVLENSQTSQENGSQFG